MKQNNDLEKYINLLELNKNIILTGAPGTGKTYLAKKIAKAMGAEYDFVQFHPSYDYTDFVEGLRPTPPDNNGNIGFERKDGVFKKFCRRAIKKELINLGGDDVSLFKKCFYELIDDIRNKKIEYIQLKQVQSTQLSVSPNNCIKWRETTGEKNIANNGVSLERLLKLYSEYKTVQDVESIKNINQSIREIIGGASSSYYWGVLREVLKRKEEYSISQIQIDAENSSIVKYIKSDIEIISSTGRTKYHIDNFDGQIITLSGTTIQGYKIPVTDVIKAYKNRLWEGGQKNGNDSYSAALAKYIYEQVTIDNIKEDKLTANGKYVFIIDEINRGEISKIFGELFFSIDPGYRGMKGRVKTQYQNMITDESDPFYEGFYVPENVYIIGTMNDIDRSVESMDFAMRRRFAWQEVKAEENTGMLDDLKEMKDEVVEIMIRLNNCIWNETDNTGIEGLNAAYHIGGSYFGKLQLYLNENNTNKEAAYRHLWENHLKGVLFEYLRGTENAMENLKRLEQVYYNKCSGDEIDG